MTLVRAHDKDEATDWFFDGVQDISDAVFDWKDIAGLSRQNRALSLWLSAESVQHLCERLLRLPAEVVQSTAKENVAYYFPGELLTTFQENVEYYFSGNMWYKLKGLCKTIADGKTDELQGVIASLSSEAAEPSVQLAAQIEVDLVSDVQLVSDLEPTPLGSRRNQKPTTDELLARIREIRGQLKTMQPESDAALYLNTKQKLLIGGLTSRTEFASFLYACVRGRNTSSTISAGLSLSECQERICVGVQDIRNATAGYMSEPQRVETLCSLVLDVILLSNAELVDAINSSGGDTAGWTVQIGAVRVQGVRRLQTRIVRVRAPPLRVDDSGLFFAYVKVTSSCPPEPRSKYLRAVRLAEMNRRNRVKTSDLFLDTGLR